MCSSFPHPFRTLAVCALAAAVWADSIPPTVLDPNLRVTTYLSGLQQPIGIAFLGPDDALILEKASGQIKRVIEGEIQPAPVLDLAVNSASERGLLSIALHPNFPRTPEVFLYWTESSTGEDTTEILEVPVLGNRVDRYLWNGSNLAFVQNIVRLRSLQTDNELVTGQPPTTANPGANGNHNGGVIHFGPDGKLYIFMGDQGRRGQLQNLPEGPFESAPLVDDTFGGPAPDDEHLSGVMLRLNPDGTTPTDNPFYEAGAAIGGEAGANIQKVFSYGHRNGFGFAFDPLSGLLWLTENGDDSFSEVNRVMPGMNGGWIQIAGPLSHFQSFRTIETTQYAQALQQRRWPPGRIAPTAEQAQARLFMLPGATYIDPELSWKYEVGPAGATFVSGNGLGPSYLGSLWIGSARSFEAVGNNGGSLYRLLFTPGRNHLDLSGDPRLADGVADNEFAESKFEGTESESLVIGRGFGTTTDIEEGPDGRLYVVSITDGTVYAIGLAVGPDQ